MSEPMPTIRSVVDRRQEACVATLERALEHARAGEYAAVTIMAESATDNSLYWSHSPTKGSFEEVLGKIEMFRWNVYRRLSGDEGPPV
jgi:hypothetical protein